MARVVYITKNPDVPDTTSGIRPNDKREWLSMCPDPMPSTPCRTPARIAPTSSFRKFLYLEKVME